MLFPPSPPDDTFGDAPRPLTMKRKKRLATDVTRQREGRGSANQVASSAKQRSRKATSSASATVVNASGERPRRKLKKRSSPTTGSAKASTAFTPKRRRSDKGTVQQAVTLLALGWKQAQDSTKQLRTLFSPDASPDYALVLATSSLLAFGLVCLFTASAITADNMLGSPFAIVLRQCVFVLLGLWGMAWVSQQGTLQFNRWTGGFSVVVLLFLAMTLFGGVTANGSERWLQIGPIQFQPSELAKPAIALILAKALAVKYTNRSEALWIAVGIVGVMTALIFKQPNLSITLLLCSTTTAMLFLGGLPLWLFTTLLPAGLMAVWQVITHTPYQMKRITGWLDPWGDPLRTGYNIIQSWLAIGPAGLLGRGFGNSVQKHAYLPFEHTDFIYSVICEEFGFVGGVLTIALYAWLAYRGFVIAGQATTPFSQYLAFGITWVLMAQAGINLAVATGLFPVTGVTLPLISYGGTSVVVTLAMVGMLLAIARETQATQHQESNLIDPLQPVLQHA
ncbi:MAG: FtsW/RodA/SpoVE family cell cycle protein [Vampirovibrionales bacterium]